MKRVLRVADTHNNVFLHMSEILDVVKPEAAELHWTILDLGQAFAPEGSNLDVLTVERQVTESPDGLLMTFAELVHFASRLQQVIDGVFAASSDAARLPSRADTDDAVLEQADRHHLLGLDRSIPGSDPPRLDGRRPPRAQLGEPLARLDFGTKLRRFERARPGLAQRDDEVAADVRGTWSSRRCSAPAGLGRFAGDRR